MSQTGGRDGIGEKRRCLYGLATPLTHCGNTVNCCHFQDWDFDPMIPFKPTVEPNLPGGFLTEHPVQIIQGGQSARVPLIVGITKEDGALRAAGKIIFLLKNWKKLVF